MAQIFKSPLEQVEEGIRKEKEDKKEFKFDEVFSPEKLNSIKSYCDKHGVDFEKAKKELANRHTKFQTEVGFGSKDAADASVDTLIDDIVSGIKL